MLYNQEEEDGVSYYYNYFLINTNFYVYITITAYIFQFLRIYFNSSADVPDDDREGEEKPLWLCIKMVYLRRNGEDGDGAPAALRDHAFLDGSLLYTGFQMAVDRMPRDLPT